MGWLAGAGGTKTCACAASIPALLVMASDATQPWELASTQLPAAPAGWDIAALADGDPDYVGSCGWVVAQESRRLLQPAADARAGLLMTGAR